MTRYRVGDPVRIRVGNVTKPGVITALKTFDGAPVEDTALGDRVRADVRLDDSTTEVTRAAAFLLPPDSGNDDELPPEPGEEV